MTSLLPISEVARRLRRSLSTVREYHRAHGLPVVKVGDSWLGVREEAFEEWLQSREETTAQEVSTDSKPARGVSRSASARTDRGAGYGKFGNAGRLRPPAESSARSRPASVLDFPSGSRK